MGKETACVKVGSKIKHIYFGYRKYIFKGIRTVISILHTLFAWQYTRHYIYFAVKQKNAVRQTSINALAFKVPIYNSTIL